jgi:hypothetical protein
VCDPHFLSFPVILFSGVREGNKVTDRNSVPPEFQPGVTRSPELDSVMQALVKLRTTNAQGFASFLIKNEGQLFPVLSRYGYRGSWEKPADMLRDFDKAERVWEDFGAEASDGFEPSKPPAKPDAWQRVWQAAASDPLAAAWILASVLVSEELGNRFGFAVDPVRLLAGSELFSTTVSMIGMAAKGSATPRVPPAGLGPQRSVLGSVKSVLSARAGMRELLSKYSAQLPDTDIVSLVTYDELGNIFLEQRLAGGWNEKIFEGQIARVRPENLPKAPFGTSAHGNDMEPVARGALGTATDQYFNENKHPSASGPDIEPRRGPTRFNLLPPDINRREPAVRNRRRSGGSKTPSEEKRQDSREDYPLPPPVSGRKSKQGPSLKKGGYDFPLPPTVHTSAPSPTIAGQGTHVPVFRPPVFTPAPFIPPSVYIPPPPPPFVPPVYVPPPPTRTAPPVYVPPSPPGPLPTNFPPPPTLPLSVAPPPTSPVNVAPPPSASPMNVGSPSAPYLMINMPPPPSAPPQWLPWAGASVSPAGPPSFWETGQMPFVPTFIPPPPPPAPFTVNMPALPTPPLNVTPPMPPVIVIPAPPPPPAPSSVPSVIVIPAPPPMMH